MSTLTPEAKKDLSKTIRDLRELLLRGVHDEAERRYRLSVAIDKAKLDQAHHIRRERLEAWLDEHVRALGLKNKKDQSEARARLLTQAEKEAAATFLNRLVLLRQLEAFRLSRPEVLTGGFRSPGYREFREFAPALTSDDSEGYGALLDLIFRELAVDLPGLFGNVGLTELFPIPAATLREAVEKLDDKALESAWTDDTTLGWVYQYWNDPEREALDAKIAGGGKIEPHEIASKTQMFTERYMVEWLLHNSLGLMWLAMCKRNGWTPAAETVLPVLDARRAEWRKKREAGEVEPDALMPIEAGLEDRWKYFVPQPIPEATVESAPRAVRDLKLLDPACGSGHFLVIAFDLLAALYREEARHTGQAEPSPREIAESILERNLHGIDIDPRATQIAAAGLYLKAKSMARDAAPKHLNVVAPVLELSELPKDDPALVELRRSLMAEAGIPETVTDGVVSALEGVDHLGSLLRIDAALDEVLRAHELEVETTKAQGQLFGGFEAEQVKLPLPAENGAQKATVLDKLEQFLDAHGKASDLGLRLDGEQLAAGVRFVRMAKEGRYDVVVGNPPYQGTSRMANAGYVARQYPRGKADLFAAFLERGLELVRAGGLSGLLTMRGWMFLGQYAELRKHLLRAHGLSALGDVDRGAFEDVPDEVLATVMSIFCRDATGVREAIAVQPTALDDRSRDGGRTSRKRAGVLAQVGRYEFDPRGFEVIEGEPIVYWWSKEDVNLFKEFPTLGSSILVAAGVKTGDDTRFLRHWFEVRSLGNGDLPSESAWHFYIKGAAGAEWIEPPTEVISWRSCGLELKTFGVYVASGTVRLRDPSLYFRRGIAFSPIGAAFSARAHWRPSIFGNMGSSAFPADIAGTLCTMNSSRARRILQSLNPGLHFENDDVQRLPLFRVPDADTIFSTVEEAFSEHEAATELAAAFRTPGPSAWTYAQAWAQRAVDRAPGEPLSPYEPVYDPPAPEAFVSFAVGVALGRFGANGEGILDAPPASALPGGILYLSASGSGPDSLEHSACKPLDDAWKEHGAQMGEGDDLRTYLRKSFFAYHKKLYESRPIYFPISSDKKNFVAFISIHRWQDDTLSVLLADHLVPERRRLEGELEDQKKARAEKTGKSKAENRYAAVQKLLEELNALVEKVTELAERGPPPPDDKTPRREKDARYAMDLDDGVMVNSAALWPLLEPQWKDPKKWWKELATAQGRKDYDWSHLAARYFPTRVAAKCEKDPSLAVAHHCFWRLHPAKAYAWELRLQDEIRPDFTIDEPGSDEARAKFLAEHEREAVEIRAAEQKRRERKARKAEAEEVGDGPLFEQGAEEGSDETADDDN